MKFTDFLVQWTALPTPSTEDILGCFLPLVRETLLAHQRGLVAPLQGVDKLNVDGQRLWFEEHHCPPPTHAGERLQTIQLSRRRGWDVTNLAARELDLDTGEQTIQEYPMASDRAQSDVRYFPSYHSWEHALGHHDPLSDLFSLGMILASLALQLDFQQPGQLEQFINHRDNLFRLKPQLHPVLAQIIRQMTELHRDARPQDLTSVLTSLENYRDQNITIETQLALDQIINRDAQLTASQRLLLRLRDRLFDLSRRNPLLNFRQTGQTLNLTQASVPLTINLDNIRADQLLIWDEPLQAELISGKPLLLNQRINFNEAVYTSSVLERLIADARRDRQEYGCSQLRVIIVTLHWADLKVSPVQQYVSPLVLLPIELSKQKGIRDRYVVQATSTTAEINPVIRHLFRELYSMVLPETIELDTGAIDRLFELLNSQIKAKEPAITLDKIQRPRVELIHEKAKRRLDQYRRSSRVAGRGAARFEEIEYSYDSVNYHPLGIRLFTQRVKQPNFHLQRLMNIGRLPRQYAVTHDAESADAMPASHATSPPPTPELPDTAHETVTVQRDIAFIKDASSDNPYHWSFDLCSVTLANLHYRRMSLVRDYEAIAQGSLTNPAFEAAFHYTDQLSSPTNSTQLPEIPLLDRFEVVASDPTQTRAIAQARTGQSYIIQGPPGTGKSQTITNLIADFVARGQRVLFVCEKRAAIDVVYARLSQCGLGQLCSLVHDSQRDKKEFIQDLKATYEAFTEPEDSKVADKRQKVLQQLNRSLHGLHQYQAAMQSPAVADRVHAVSRRELLDRVLSRSATVSLPLLPAEVTGSLPELSLWSSVSDQLDGLRLRLEHINPQRQFCQHPLHRLAGPMVAQDQARPKIAELIVRANEQLDQLTDLVKTSGCSVDESWTLAQWLALLQHLQRLSPLASQCNLTLLDRKSPLLATFRRELNKINRIQGQLQSASERTLHWRSKLSPNETRTALEQSRQFRSNIWRWLMPGWWRLRGILNRSYNFSAHRLRPTWIEILEDLQNEHAVLATLDQAKQDLQAELGLTIPPDQADELLRQLQDELPHHALWLRQTHEQLVNSPDANDLITDLLMARPALDALLQTLDQLLAEPRTMAPQSVRVELSSIAAHLDQLPRVADIVQLIDSLPPPIAHLVRTQPLTFAQMEAAVEYQAWSGWLQSQPEIERFHAGEQSTHVQQLEKLLPKWLQLNANEVCQRARQRFIEHAQPHPSHPEAAKRFRQGCKVLEHEFGKTMRYRPIRELVDGDSGLPIRDLKPIWLMSPLSVSDTLPLTTQFVDVVIFDEASQVRLEDAVPTLFRGVQTIIVGDTMQLPPTNFFAQKSNEPEEDESTLAPVASEEAPVDTDLSADSLLRHAGKRLPSTMLGWHYRSRSESLISFSNWAFYEGRLLTVPDVSLPPTKMALSTTDSAQASPVPPTAAQSVWPSAAPTVWTMPATVAEQPTQYNAANQPAGRDWLQQPISYHYLAEGCYEDRRNMREAEHVAALVAQCLVADSQPTVGIIAFSEAQQSEIERALDNLAQVDPDFAQRYQQELTREEDGQYVGLLVKNLENIQGDERDVIILSVCYGPNAKGRLSMNFGPINRDGGEKRLNVAFSRAKRHMAVVTSMQWSQIRNDYNFGPRCLKQYLRYAECQSAGDATAAEQAIVQLGVTRSRLHTAREELDPVTTSLTTALIERGYCVDNLVGQSLFRIHAAIYKPGDTQYRLGILVDTVDNYQSADAWEREVMRPKLLRDFGWRVISLLGQDWWRDPTAQLDRILNELSN